MSFKNLNLINPIIRAVTEAGYSKPTEIQDAAIPPILKGRDMIGCSPLGTGKTAAFVLPVLQLLKRSTPEHKEVRTLILASTRELVLEIEEHFILYSKYLPISQLSIFDGVLAGSQLAALRARVDILIATPGRLLDLMNQRSIDLSKIEILVLDKADQLLDKEFADDVKKILRIVSQKRQTLFFAETMKRDIRKLANTLSHNPIEITIIPPSTQTIQTENNTIEETPASFCDEEDSGLNTIQKLTGFAMPVAQNKTFQYTN